jgi:hypothetical protein
MNATVRRLAIAGTFAGALVAAAGCGGSASGHVTAARLNAVPHAGSPMTQQADAGVPASQPVAPSPTAFPSGDPMAPVAASPAAATGGYEGPHFTSPESAMTYLTAAYNSDDAAALHPVTTPNSYLELTQMRSEAVNLQLQYCTADANRGDYYCYFQHEYPASLDQAGHGASTMLIAPAANPGWYLYAVVDCG